VCGENYWSNGVIFLWFAKKRLRSRMRKARMAPSSSPERSGPDEDVIIGVTARSRGDPGAFKVGWGV